MTWYTGKTSVYKCCILIISFKSCSNSRYYYHLHFAKRILFLKSFSQAQRSSVWEIWDLNPGCPRTITTWENDTCREFEKLVDTEFYQYWVALQKWNSIIFGIIFHKTMTIFVHQNCLFRGVSGTSFSFLAWILSHWYIGNCYSKCLSVGNKQAKLLEITIGEHAIQLSNKDPTKNNVGLGELHD